MPRDIDLNSDLGEGMPSDAEVMESVTSANVACGAHAGDAETMRRTVRLALERGIAIGAHPSYADRERFGRVALEIPDADLREQIRGQLEALASVARGEGARVRYVKAHGALYNRGERDERIADVLCDAVASFDRALALVCTPGSAMSRRARARGMRILREGFCDRAYEPDGTLRPRSQPGAVIAEPWTAAAQGLALAARGDVDTLCVHGDTPGAAAIARRVRAALEDAGYRVAPAE